jgi:flavodoxin
MIVFSSKGNTTQKIATALQNYWREPMPLYDLRVAAPDLANTDAGVILLLSPTYGDEELEELFELFLVRTDWTSLSGKYYAFCEIGIYTGYEDFGHGLSCMVDSVLQKAGLKPIVGSLSLDSVPLKSLELLERWVMQIKANLSVHA